MNEKNDNAKKENKVVFEIQQAKWMGFYYANYLARWLQKEQLNQKRCILFSLSFKFYSFLWREMMKNVYSVVH